MKFGEIISWQMHILLQQNGPRAAVRDGALAEWHPANLGAQVLNAIVKETGIDPAAVEDVIMGCVTQAGEQAGQVGRTAVMASDLPRLCSCRDD